MQEIEFSRHIVPLRDRMFRYAHSLLLSSDEAEDVVHDLLERLWRDREGLDACRNLSAFVLTAVRRRKGVLERMLGLAPDRRIRALLALGLPRFRYPNSVDRTPAPVSRL